PGARSSTKRSEPPLPSPPAFDRPTPEPRVARQPRVGVDGDGRAHPLEQREIVVAVRVEVALREIHPVLLRPPVGEGDLVAPEAERPRPSGEGARLRVDLELAREQMLDTDRRRDG